MAQLIAWPPSSTSYPGVQTFRVHAEVVKDMVFDRSADKTPTISMIREGARTSNKQFYHVCDRLEPVTDPSFYTRSASGANSDWTRTAGGATTLGDPRGITYVKRMPFDQATQNFREDVEVHNDNDFYKAFGVAKEYAYQVVKKSKRLGIMKEKRNYEDIYYVTTSIENSMEHVGNPTQDPTMTRPFIEQLILNSETNRFNYIGNVFRAEDLARIGNAQVSKGTGTNGVATTNLPTQQLRINEDLLTKVLEITSGNDTDPDAMPDVFGLSTSPYSHLGGLGSVVSPSGNLGALTLSRSADLEKIKRAVRSYESQIGPVAFFRTRWIPQANNLGTATGITKPTSPISGRSAVSPNGNPGYLWGFQTDSLENHTFRPFMHKPLPENGDSAIGYLHGEDGIDLYHPQSAMVVIGINNN